MGLVEHGRLAATTGDQVSRLDFLIQIFPLLVLLCTKNAQIGKAPRGPTFREAGFTGPRRRPVTPGRSRMAPEHCGCVARRAVGSVVFEFGLIDIAACEHFSCVVCRIINAAIPAEFLREES